MGGTVLKVAASKEEEEGDEKDARDPGGFAQSDHSQSQAPPLATKHRLISSTPPGTRPSVIFWCFF